MKQFLTPKSIIDIARQWLGTPYLHQASVKNRGCDCLGFVRGVWREAIGAEPEPTPNYSPDWGEAGQREILKLVVDRYFEKTAAREPKPANLLLFRWNESSIIKHLGVMTYSYRFIHAYEKSGVVESPLAREWVKRIAGIYCFPGVSD